jgi:hypothetical protein
MHLTTAKQVFKKMTTKLKMPIGDVFWENLFIIDKKVFAFESSHMTIMN